jgi:hypothetical protein
MPIRMADERFGYLGGEIWPPGPDFRYRFEWNTLDIGGCDYPDARGSAQLYVCGDGFGVLTGSAISGVIRGRISRDQPCPYCTAGEASHRFALAPKTRSSRRRSTDPPCACRCQAGR